jgi:uncharacterized membrane protein HdeD (DUF308 family)
VSETPDYTAGAPMVGPERRAMARELGRTWWVFLILGIIWVLFGLFVLSYRVGSLLALAILAGILFLIGGIAELMAAFRAPGWRWLYAIAGVFSIIAGIVAFVWPGITLYVLAIVLSWYLIFMGIFHVVGSLSGPKGDWWWLTLLLGIAEFLLGAWAAGYPGRSLLVFVNLVGFYALIHGFTEIFGAFTLRGLSREVAR